MAQFEYVVVGLAGDSPGAYEGGRMSEVYKGLRVSKGRVCMNQPTTICETQDGRKLWVENSGLKRVEPTRPEVGKGVFWCGCSTLPHKDREVNDRNILRLLSHVTAVYTDAMKHADVAMPDGWMHDIAPGPEFSPHVGGVQAQIRQKRKYGGIVTVYGCPEAQVAAYCAAMGWIEFNDDLTASRMTTKGLEEQSRRLQVYERERLAAKEEKEEALLTE